MTTKKALKALTPEELKKRNAAFWRLSKEKQRLAIAHDVIEQVKRQRFIGQGGSYVAFENILFAYKKLQRKLLTSDMSCAVCGLGAAIVSAIRLGNKLSLRPVIYGLGPHAQLECIFDSYQLALIESAFEGDSFGILAFEDNRPFKAYREKYPDNSKRLVAIYQNIIRNDGVFKMPRAKKEKKS